MKKLFMVLTAAVSFYLPQALAQEVMVEGVMPRGFSGVHTTNNGDMYYTVFLSDMDAPADSLNLVMRVYDRMMQPMTEAAIPVTKTSHIAASGFTGQMMLIVLADADNKTRTTMLVDQAGNIFKRKDEKDIRPALLSNDAFPSVYNVGMNEFVLMHPQKGKGIELEGIDPELSPVWQKSIGAGGIVELKTEMERMYLLKKETRDGKEVYSIQGVIGGSGDNFLEADLREADNIAVPGFMNLKDGFIETAGIYQKEGNTAGRSEGIFIANIDPAGRPEFMRFISWEMIKQHSQSDVIAELENGKTHILMQDVISKGDQGYILIGELFKKAAGTEANSTLLSVGDMAFIHVSKDGQVDKVERMPKTAKEVLVKGPMAGDKTMQLAQWLDKNNFFTFRDAVHANGKDVIIYQDMEGGKMKAYFAALDTNGMVTPKNIMSADFDSMAEEENSGRRNKKQAPVPASRYMLNSFVNEEVQDFINSQSQKFIVPLNDGMVMMYSYTDPQLRLWVQPVNVP